MNVPIIITQHEQGKCPSCGKAEEVISVCKHCGHEYKDDDKVSVSGIILLTAIIIVILGFIAFVLFVWDNKVNDGNYLRHLTTTSDCSYTVPKPYEIKENKKGECIIYNSELDSYLCLGRGEEYEWCKKNVYYEPILFFNKCKAKGYLKEYLSEKENEKFE